MNLSNVSTETELLMRLSHAVAAAAMATFAATCCLPAIATIVGGSINTGAAGSVFQTLTTPLNNLFGTRTASEGAQELRLRTGIFTRGVQG